VKSFPLRSLRPGRVGEERIKSRKSKFEIRNSYFAIPFYLLGILLVALGASKVIGEGVAGFFGALWSFDVDCTPLFSSRCGFVEDRKHVIERTAL
jgi:hypothetical protein